MRGRMRELDMPVDLLFNRRAATGIHPRGWSSLYEKYSVYTMVDTVMLQPASQLTQLRTRVVGAGAVQRREPQHRRVRARRLHGLHSAAWHTQDYPKLLRIGHGAAEMHIVVRKLTSASVCGAFACVRASSQAKSR